MTTLGLILARGGSKGIPGKNLQEVGECPLIVRTVREAKSSRLDRVCVYSDSEEIRTLAALAQAEVFDRPSEVSSDTTTSEESVRRFLSDQDNGKDRDPSDWVMMIQCTTPFLRAEHIDMALNAVLADKSLDSVISVTHLPRYLGYIINGRWIPMYPNRWRRQDYNPPFYIENGGFYLAKRSLWESGKRIGASCAVAVMGWYESMEIDEPCDLDVARRISGMFPDDA